MPFGAFSTALHALTQSSKTAGTTAAGVVALVRLLNVALCGGIGRDAARHAEAEDLLRGLEKFFPKHDAVRAEFDRAVLDLGTYVTGLGRAGASGAGASAGGVDAGGTGAGAGAGVVAGAAAKRPRVELAHDE